MTLTYLRVSMYSLSNFSILSPLDLYSELEILDGFEVVLDSPKMLNRFKLLDGIGVLNRFIIRNNFEVYDKLLLNKLVDLLDIKLLE